MAARVFFFHNPKAGGTAIANWIRLHRPESRLCPIFENDLEDHQRNNGRYEKFAGYDIYIGHYGRDIFESIASDAITMTNFRQPVARLISLYNYFRYSVDMPKNSHEMTYAAVAYAKSVSFEKFVLSDRPEIRAFVQNHHFRQLTSSGWDLTERSTLDVAKKFIDQMQWFYVCELPATSLKWAASALGWGLSNPRRENVSTKNSVDIPLDDALAFDIEALNSLDVELYRYAKERLKCFEFNDFAPC